MAHNKNKNIFKTIALIITLNILINISITNSTPHKSQANDLPSSIGINEVKIGHNNHNNNNNKILDDEVISSDNNNESDYSDNEDDDTDIDDENNGFDDDPDKGKTIKDTTQSTIDEQIQLLSKQLKALTERRSDDLKSLENSLRKYVRKNAVQILNEDLKRELEDLR